MQNCAYFVCDLSKDRDIKKTFMEILKKYPKIDILVNNAGIYKENESTHKAKKDGSIEFDSRVIQDLINVNMLAYWMCGLYAAEPMKKSKEGVIINISSVNSICGKVVCDVYDMTKAAVNNLTLNQAMQLADFNVRVNAICPSSTVTSMRDKAMGEYPPEEGREGFDRLEASMVPLKRLGRPEDIAFCALYLASNEASYITGQVISVDGGFLLKRQFPALFPKKSK
jgi:3-oxoacyl-[acyl-carrier protein] reductase